MFIKVLVIPDSGNPVHIRLNADRICEISPNAAIIGETVAIWVDGPVVRQYRCKMTFEEWDRILLTHVPGLMSH